MHFLKCGIKILLFTIYIVVSSNMLNIRFHSFIFSDYLYVSSLTTTYYLQDRAYFFIYFLLSSNYIKFDQASLSIYYNEDS